jgi:hypothetical protein
VELRDRIANDSNDGKFVLGFDKSECQWQYTIMLCSKIGGKIGWKKLHPIWS